MSHGQSFDASAPRVYAAMRSPRFDTRSLRPFGALHVVFPPEFNPSKEPAKAIKRLQAAFTEFDPEVDSVCSIGGDPCGDVLVGAVLTKLFAGRSVRWLRFERAAPGEAGPRGFYEPCWVTLPAAMP